MPIYVVRHAMSEANNRENIGTLAFASKEASLMGEGRNQARKLGGELIKLGVNVRDTPVAVSKLRRTQETAQVAGFTDLHEYAALDEVAHGMGLPDLRAMLDDGKLPVAAIKTAEKILRKPPVETVWVTHGLVIAGLCQVLNASKGTRLVPKFCEIRELPI